MNLGGNAQQQLAGSGFLGMYALFLAIDQIVLNCKLNLLTQFGNRYAMETDDGANAKNASRKDIVTLVILDASGVALVQSSMDVQSDRTDGVVRKR